MPGMKFQYDEDGGTFYYFLLSVVCLILFPSTFFFWPRGPPPENPEHSKHLCHCDACQSKKQKLKARKPWEERKKKLIKLILLVGWCVFFLLAYKVSTIEIDHTEYDPYQILEIDKGASTSEIKQAYRRLSRIHHPDRGGSHKMFMLISKAHQALTDEEARKNWEEHGNPDGPGITRFGIALPVWLVAEKNSIWVLAAYGLAFIVILPIVVGTWWYRSIKYSPDAVLLDTTQLFYYFFHKTPNMIVRRALMILCGAMEFSRTHNPDIVERPSDNDELPPIMRELTRLEEKSRERPLCAPYSLKVRTLLHAHLERLSLPPNTLQVDKDYALRKCPSLINEMVNTTAALTSMAHAGRIPGTKIPRLETVEHVMKLSPMVVQAMWDNKSPFLQLPHISPDLLRHFEGKKRSIRSLRQFCRLSVDERRSILRTLSDSEFRDVQSVLASMPDVSMKLHTEVKDEEDSSITVGSLVTVSVTLTRSSLDPGIEGAASHGTEDVPLTDDEAVEHDKLANGDAVTDSPVVKKQQKVWEKNKKQKKKGKSAAKKKAEKQRLKVKEAAAAALAEKQKAETAAVEEPKKNKSPDESESEVESDASDEVSSGSAPATPKPKKESGKREEEQDTDDEEWFKEFQRETRKETSLERKAKESHLVHCPYFPLEKHEFWWLFVADRRNHALITNPIQVCTLKDFEETSLKFSAPHKCGTYTYTVCLRSDSYLDLDTQQNIKFDVKEARAVLDHPQWDLGEEEEQAGDELTETESEGSDYSDESEDE